MSSCQPGMPRVRLGQTVMVSVKPTERKTTGPLAQQGQHLKTPRQGSVAISAMGKSNYELQEILPAGMVFWGVSQI